MDGHSIVRSSPPPASGAGLDHGEELLADVDEPPDEKQQGYFWPSAMSTRLPVPSPYSKALPAPWLRRESLLTRQLHSETEHTEDEEHRHLPRRGLSTVSTWSNPSAASTAELTSDDGHSMPSPAVSPPLSPTSARDIAGPGGNMPAGEPQILGLETLAAQPAPVIAPLEKVVEAELGRKRCISFACGKKEQPKPVAPVPPPTETKPASPPKRRCMIKFACPMRASQEGKATEGAKRPASPAPPQSRPMPLVRPTVEKVHRGSDSTVTHASPVRLRKSHSPSINVEPATPATMTRRMSHNSDDSGPESTRFHEFAHSEEEHEGWVQESTCHRMRLTVNDTLKKENVIRKLTEEAEEEALEEDEDADLDDDDLLENGEEDEDDDAEDDDVEEAVHDEADDDDESDVGFHSDNEKGFASSDSEDDGSDYEWWKPGGMSTAATSTDQLEHMATHIRADRVESGSSIDSIDVGRTSPRPKRRHPRLRTRSRSGAVQIDRPPTPDLPDSTDFVCGTLDEDRPMEQAYINCMKQREAAKHKPAPQDIDPTFPTSDPEMDEEDDEDIEDPEESESEAMVHGDLDELHGTARRKSPAPFRRRSKGLRSPPPPTRHRSPAPARHHSPAPTAIRHKSPAPRAKSPAPVRRSICRSPPPPARGRSPMPARKLFGHSPKRTLSPAHGAPMTSPPNTRRTSPSAFNRTVPMHGLAARPSHATHTASLPRSGGFLISRMARLQAHDDSDTAKDGDAPKKRGAIDIVKGLEKKRLRRKEKLYQKACAKAAAKPEKPYKVKPGKGCERMREVGLELQKYKGKGGHILSV
ncbi:hypothetical protein B0A48_02277 [Cryoendolithus antarcticus]|uniref:Extensin domain-containing protein n=1 Tax=Cryoendolithus antarcticus TaxID=1507870 RepID=A0A1V8TN56_9PEZI|nr:hypothetical protein B0A48_02277 [Cryoendolithus antarcticus]